MQSQKVAPTRDEDEYRKWVVQVLQPFAARTAKKDMRALFDDEHNQKMLELGFTKAESDEAKLLQRLLHLRAFAEAHCAQTLQERARMSEKGYRTAVQDLEKEIQRIYQFLQRSGRAQRYGIDLSQVSLNTFKNRDRAATLCRLLRAGLQKEIRHALHSRLALFLNATPIGGDSKRKFDVEPLLQFALEKRLENVEDAALYEMFVEEKMRRAMAGETLMEDELEPEQFELMSGSSSAPRPILTENNQICSGPCSKSGSGARKVCRTNTYRKYGLKYNWDYCD